ncbi:MAG: rod shape-determining protein RodA [Gammaproteobacteria bacterium]|nr:rod shape-determining protein RodA [Gammaproteobacteria bacterium]
MVTHTNGEKYHGFTTSILHLDIWLLGGLLTLSGIGLTVLYSTGGESVFWRQSVRLLLGFAVLFGVAQIPPLQLRHWAPWLYGGGVLLLLAVLVIGTSGGGARRWLDLGVVRFQPSELMKLIVPMTLAWYLADKPLPANYKHFLIAGLLAVVPTLLIARQPDLGTALLIGSSGIFVLLLAGLDWRLVIGGLLAGVTAIAGVLFLPWLSGLLHEYQKQRILTFFDPEKDPLGAGYHIIQSKIAVGSGGLYGKGLGEGTQSHLDFLPERSTDFIFAVFSEDLGFIRVLMLLAVYFFVLSRGLYIAAQAQGTFARLLAGSITLTFFVYVFVNIGMVTGLLPVVGLPLPLISYGGSSLVTLLASFGLLMGVHTHRRLLSG